MTKMGVGVGMAEAASPSGWALWSGSPWLLRPSAYAQECSGQAWECSSSRRGNAPSAFGDAQECSGKRGVLRRRGGGSRPSSPACAQECSGQAYPSKSVAVGEDVPVPVAVAVGTPVGVGSREGLGREAAVSGVTVSVDGGARVSVESCDRNA
jgi:hypothetical protein